MSDDPRALAAQAADTMETALDAEGAALPGDLAEQYRAGVRIARQGAGADVSDEESREHIEQALQQFAEPPGIFMPDTIIRAGQTVRTLLDRARSK